MRDIIALWWYESHIKRSLSQFTAALLRRNNARNYCKMLVVVIIQK